MLSIQGISKQFNLTTVLDQVSFTLQYRERVGLIGPNGCGKTTLLRIIMGLETADQGSVRFNPADLIPGYLPQGSIFPDEETLGDWQQHLQGDLAQLSARLEALAEKFTRGGSSAELEEEYAIILARVERSGVDSGKARSVLGSLGLADLDPNLPLAALSGGQKTRLGLAGLLLKAPRLLLLDEPTNHLDIAMLEWLEEWLSKYDGALLIISHDRVFLDHTVTAILDLDGRSHRLRRYEGNYSAFLDQKQAEQDRHWQEYTDQQVEITRLRQDIVRTRNQAAETERKASSVRLGGGIMKLKGMKDYQHSIAKKVAAKAKAREKKLERFMDAEERVEKPHETWQMKIEFDAATETGRDVLVLEELEVGYPGNSLLKDLNLTLRHGSRAVLLGPNGCGKTTLIRTILGQIQAMAGTFRLGTAVRLGYMSQEQDTLKTGENPLTTLLELCNWNETEARSFLSKYLFKGDDVFTPVENLSYGERSRLMLAALIAGGCNFLLLDEPINHLDIPARTTFENALAGFEGTVLAVVHDRYFIERYASLLWRVEAGRVHEIRKLTYALLEN